MRSTPSLSEVFPKLPLKWVPMFVRLTMALSRPFKEDRQALPLSTALSTPLSLALCPQVVSQASQHFRSSEKQATCEGCFARQSTSVNIAVRLKRLMASVSTCSFQIQHAIYYSLTNCIRKALSARSLD